MPFNSIPAQDFLNREPELAYLKGLAEMKRASLSGNVILEGSRGIGKTELLRQLYRELFREDKIAPFYYSFKTANLKAANFARDYFTRFIRQYISFLQKEPSIGEAAASPLNNLLPVISSLGMDWLADCIEEFQELQRSNDLYWQMVAAISAPAAAARKGGLPVLVMLDDFDAAEHLYESSRGDAHGLTSLFDEPMRCSLCSHIVTGSAAVLEAIFTDHSLIETAEKLRLGPLPEDLGRALFNSQLEKLKMPSAPAEALRFLNMLRGNPLYIRNLAKTAWRMNKTGLSARDMLECYCYEVSEGQTSLYWSSVLGRYTQVPAKRRWILKLLMRSFEKGAAERPGRLSRVLGLSEAEAITLLDEIQASGITRDQDIVLRDFIRCLYMKEVEGRDPAYVREAISSRYGLAGANGNKFPGPESNPEFNNESCYEMVIPMSQNAELVAAKAMEQIACNMDLDPEFVNYLQLALIEICLNAMEHSGSHEKKVFLKFMTSGEKLVITIESPGRPFSPEALKDVPVGEKLRTGQKRGWGLKLVSGIMDDVKVERAGDRTRVILTKNIKDKEVHR